MSNNKNYDLRKKSIPCFMSNNRDEVINCVIIAMQQVLCLIIEMKKMTKNGRQIQIIVIDTLKQKTFVLIKSAVLRDV